MPVPLIICLVVCVAFLIWLGIKIRKQHEIESLPAPISASQPLLAGFSVYKDPQSRIGGQGARFLNELIQQGIQWSDTLEKADLVLLIRCSEERVGEALFTDKKGLPIAVTNWNWNYNFEFPEITRTFLRNADTILAKQLQIPRD